MKRTCALSAIGALTLSSAALAETQLIDLGTFWNTPPAGTVGYSGDYGSFISSSPYLFDYLHTVVSVDVSSLLQSVGANALVSVTVTDTGSNSSGPLSPGADLDLFAFTGLPADAQSAIAYTGPNAVHAAESMATLADRVAAVDAFSGAQDAWNLTHVSLGTGGSLKTTFSSPSAPGGPLNALFYGGGSGGSGLVNPVKLLLSEAGYSESYRVTLEVDTVAIPAPAAGALLALAGLAGRGRRRRSC